MKITIKPVTTYEIEIDGQGLGIFTLESKWEGFSCFKHTKSHHKIIASINHDFIGQILGHPTEGDVYKLSPDLLLTVRKVNPGHES